MRKKAPFPMPDWREKSGSQDFYGYDNDDGTTSWYGSDGSLDCVTDTPRDYDSRVWDGTLEKF